MRGLGDSDQGRISFLATVTQEEFQCTEKGVRVLASAEFSHHMGTGQAADGDVDQI